MCLVTEFLPQGSLASVIKKFPQISWILRLKFAIDTARGMAFLHKSNICHLDLKPDNVLCVSLSTRAPVTCKVSDFGTSTRIGFQQTLSQRGVGTPIYMAPEILGKKPYDFKADMYSYGIMFWEIATGRIPFESIKHSHEIYDHVIHGNRPQIPASIPPFISQLMQAAWSGDPSNRPGI